MLYTVHKTNEQRRSCVTWVHISRDVKLKSTLRFIFRSVQLCHAMVVNKVKYEFIKPAK